MRPIFARSFQPIHAENQTSTTKFNFYLAFAVEYTCSCSQVLTRSVLKSTEAFARKKCWVIQLVGYFGRANRDVESTATSPLLPCSATWIKTIAEESHDDLTNSVKYFLCSKPRFDDLFYPF